MHIDQMFLGQLLFCPGPKERVHALLVADQMIGEEWQRRSAEPTSYQQRRLKVSGDTIRNPQRTKDVNKITLFSRCQHSRPLPNNVKHQFEDITFDSRNAERAAKERQAAVSATDIDEVARRGMRCKLSGSKPHHKYSVGNFGTTDDRDHRLCDMACRATHYFSVDAFALLEPDESGRA